MAPLLALELFRDCSRAFRFGVPECVVLFHDFQLVEAVAQSVFLSRRPH